MYVAVQATDVTDLVLVERELRHRSTHDPLTGLANRAMLDRLFDREPHSSAALIYLDLDRFKPVNDSYGHGVGDQVLCTIADRLRHEVRACEVVVRLGGDEFVVVCGDGDVDQVAPLADRLVQLCAHPITVGSTRIRLAASAGVAYTLRPDSATSSGARTRRSTARSRAAAPPSSWRTVRSRCPSGTRARLVPSAGIVIRSGRTGPFARDARSG